MAIHLTIESRFHPSGRYHVGSLLEAILPKTIVDSARSDRRNAYDLKQRWDNALKLLISLCWQVHFDEETYPAWLQPGSSTRKPNGYLDKLLVAKITILQPDPIPALLTSKTEPKRINPAKPTAPLTTTQVRKARETKGWNQRKLAGWLGISQSLIAQIERGQRSISPDIEAKLRELLNIQD